MPDRRLYPIPVVWTALVLAPFVLHATASAQPAPAHSATSGAPAAASAPTASAAASAAATMEAIPEQVVWLTNGAILRGQIVELAPQQHVTLQLATGELRTIPWADIARSTFVSPAAAPPTAAPSASPPPPAPTPTAAPDAVHLELRGDRSDLWLEARRRFTDDPWTIACRAPCARAVQVSDLSLRIAGPGIRPSNPFFIDGRGGHEVLVAQTGSAETHAWGQRSLVGGIGIGLAGGAAYGLGKVGDSDPAVVGGLIGMITGGALLALALPLLSSSSTHVRNAKGDRVGRTDATFVW